MIQNEKISELLKLKNDGFLFHRESQDLEFKEQFNFGGLAEYFKDFAGFANNKGGYIIFGVSNSPRRLIGLNPNSYSQFSTIDPEKISGYLLDIFSPNIFWEQSTFEFEDKKFGIFYVHEAESKPVIAKKDEGRDNIIKNGEIYFRYGGRTQKIQHAELHNIIRKRIDSQNQQWQNLFSKIAKVGPSKAAILDTEKGLIEKDKNQILVLDKKLLDDISFIKEGHIKKGEGKTLKLVGEVYPVDSIEVVKVEKKNLTELYPLTATQVVSGVKKYLPSAKQNGIYQIISENELKSNDAYSAYVFMNKEQEIRYRENGILPKSIPSIYNRATVDFVTNILRNKVE